LLALGGGGCSFAFVRPPPPQHVPAEQLVCTTSYASPIVDSVLATLGGLMTLAIASGPCLDVCESNAGIKAAAFSLPLFFLPAISAAYGTTKVTRCRIARQH
jgi:hypothetical protein